MGKAFPLHKLFLTNLGKAKLLLNLIIFKFKVMFSSTLNIFGEVFRMTKM